MARKRRPTSPLNPFYGYSAELIANWCGVSVASAEHYKAGRRRPSKTVLRLFRLYRDRKVLGHAWDGYHVSGSKLVGPDGKHITPEYIALWVIICQLAAEKSPEEYRDVLRQFGS